MPVYYYLKKKKNITNLRHFKTLYAILLPFAPLCAPLRYFTLFYSTLLYLGTLVLIVKRPMIGDQIWLRPKEILIYFWRYIWAIFDIYNRLVDRLK